MDRLLLALIVVSTPSPALAARVEPVAATVYRVTLANRSARNLIAVQYEAFRGSARVAGGCRKTERNEPLALKGREDTFEVITSTPIDRVAITAVLWDDGRIEGDGALAADERVLDIGKALQIRRVLHLLRESTAGRGPQTIRAFRAKLLALPTTGDVPRPETARVAMQQVKEAVLADLDAFDRAAATGPAVAFTTWLSDTTASYEEWLARIAAR